MNTQSPGCIRWQPTDIPPPGSIYFLKPDSDGAIQITGGIPPLWHPETPVSEPIETCLPPEVSDGIRELIREIKRPGDSVSAQVSYGPVEHEIRVTIIRLSDGNVAVFWGEVVACGSPSGYETAGDILHQTMGDIPDMLSRHDDSLVFLSATPSSYALFGYYPSELIGMSLTFHIHPDDCIRVESSCKPLIEAPGVVRIRYRIRHRKGEFRWVESVFSSTFRSDGTFSVMMASTREMGGIIRAVQAARGANAKLNLLNSILRHDLMNQITGMIGYLDILAEIVDDDDAKGLIVKEQELVTRIRHLIELTQDYQGIGLNPPGFTDVDAVVYKILAKPEFAGKIEAERFLSGLYIYTDRMFEQVVYEMVENSLSYGGDGVKIRFSYLTTDEGLILVFEDNGPGVADHEKTLIFSRTYQNRHGYGLYLATEILDITGIRIREVGLEGSGARFEIVVPHDGYRLAPNAG